MQECANCNSSALLLFSLERYLFRYLARLQLGDMLTKQLESLVNERESSEKTESVNRRPSSPSIVQEELKGNQFQSTSKDIRGRIVAQLRAVETEKFSWKSRCLRVGAVDRDSELTNRGREISSRLKFS